MLIGITGQIGAGKSTAAQVLSNMGAAVIDADKIGREVVVNNPKLLKQLVKTFGRKILTISGKLDRDNTAKIAFSSIANKRKLDRLVHPFLLQKINEEIMNTPTSRRVVVIDAALLLDWRLDKIVDRVLVIHSSEKRRFRRLLKRGITPADAKARQLLQLPYAEYRKRADKVILNNRTKSALMSKVKKWAKPLFGKETIN